MMLIDSLLCGLIHFVATALDVLFFFVLLRLAAYRFPSDWLAAFNCAGAQLVDRFSACVRQGMACISTRPYSDKMTLVIGLFALVCLAAILNLVINAGVGI
jgi:hypothetical protein